MNFDEAITAQFNEKPELKKQHPRIWRILNANPSNRRTRRVARMEEEVKIQQGKEQGLRTALPKIDWSNIDWTKVLKWIGAIIGILFAIL